MSYELIAPSYRFARRIRKCTLHSDRSSIIRANLNAKLHGELHLYLSCLVPSDCVQVKNLFVFVCRTADHGYLGYTNKESMVNAPITNQPHATSTRISCSHR